MKIAIVSFVLSLLGSVLSLVPCVGALAILWCLPGLVLGIIGLICSFKRKVVGIVFTVLILIVSLNPFFRNQDGFVWLIIFLVMLTIVMMLVVMTDAVFKKDTDPKLKTVLKILFCVVAIILSLIGVRIADEQAELFKSVDKAMNELDKKESKGKEKEIKSSGEGTSGTIDDSKNAR